MDDDLLTTEPHSFDEQPVAVDAERFDGIFVVKPLLVERALARQQLATADRAPLQVATGVVPSTAGDAAVTASITVRSPTGLGAIRRKVEVTALLMKGIHRARDGGGHVVAAPAAHGALRRWWRLQFVGKHAAAPSSIIGSDGDLGPEAQRGAR